MPDGSHGMKNLFPCCNVTLILSRSYGAISGIVLEMSIIHHPFKINGCSSKMYLFSAPSSVEHHAVNKDVTPSHRGDIGPICAAISVESPSAGHCVLVRALLTFIPAHKAENNAKCARGVQCIPPLNPDLSHTMAN